MSRPALLPPPGAASRQTGEQTLDVETLLTIDVAAEIRKLSQAQLEGPWQLPTELVRRALRTGAGTVEVALDRRGMKIRDDGGGIERDELQVLAVLLDERAAPNLRHRALVLLEAAGAPALIALVGLGADLIQIEVRVETRADRLVWERGQPPRLELASVAEEGDETRITLSGIPLEPQRAREWLESACRFCEADVRVNGEPLFTGGFENVMARLTLPGELDIELAIPHSGSTACLWLLLDSVVSAHVTLPRAPCFEAVLELAPWVGQQREAAALREIGAQVGERLVGWGCRAVCDLAGTIARWPLAQQRRIRELVTVAAKTGEEDERVEAVQVYPALPGPGGEPRWLSLGELENLADENDEALLTALYPGEDPERYVLPATPVLVLDAAERGPLAGFLGTGFQAPPLRPTARGPLARAWDALVGQGGLLERLVHRLFHPARRPPLSDEALSPTERAFRDELRSALAAGRAGPVKIELCEGAGPIRRLGKSIHWELPRGNPTVQACLKVWSQEPTWIYPAALALLGGRAIPDPRIRDAWTTRAPPG